MRRASVIRLSGEKRPFRGGEIVQLIGSITGDAVRTIDRSSDWKRRARLFVGWKRSALRYAREYGSGDGFREENEQKKDWLDVN
jgi:hypothetical protein